MVSQERGGRLQQPAASQRRTQAEPQRALRRLRGVAHSPGQRLGIAHELPRALDEVVAGLREAERPTRALDQPRTELILQPIQQAAERRLGDAASACV